MPMSQASEIPLSAEHDNSGSAPSWACDPFLSRASDALAALAKRKDTPELKALADEASARLRRACLTTKKTNDMLRRNAAAGLISGMSSWERAGGRALPKSVRATLHWVLACDPAAFENRTVSSLISGEWSRLGTHSLIRRAANGVHVEVQPWPHGRIQAKKWVACIAGASICESASAEAASDEARRVFGVLFGEEGW